MGNIFMKEDPNDPIELEFDEQLLPIHKQTVTGS